MVLKIGEFLTKSKNWANALQDENNRGWANNLQGIHFVFFERRKSNDVNRNDIILSISDYFARNNKQINMMLKKLLFFDFEKNKVNRLAHVTSNK